MTNLIGVSGKLQTGKDTITKIIQWLTFNQEHNTNIPFEKMDNYYKASNWKNVKFADKLKDCVCLILGCTREQLEDPEFKDDFLGKEWNKYKIGYITYINSSEVTVVEKEYYIYEEFINAIKKAKEDKQKYNIEIEILTPRKFLQLLGTECGRKIIHPNIWCIATFNDYKPQHYRVVKDYSGMPLYQETTMPKWIISDVRFPNEAEAIKDRNGILIRVERNTGNTEMHDSEIALDNYKNWDYVIDNNGTIEELIEKVRDILIKEKILWEE